MNPEWFTTQEVQSLGQDGYLRYLAGIAIINSPSGKFAHGVLGEGTRGPLDVLVWGEQQMIDGLADVIRAANPPDDDLLTAEHQFDDALPLMRQIVSISFMSVGAQIKRMNKAFDALRPLAVANGKTYRSICHGNYNRLRTVDLMGGVQPASMFMNFMIGPSGQTVRDVGKLGDHRLRLAE